MAAKPIPATDDLRALFVLHDALVAHADQLMDAGAVDAAFVVADLADACAKELGALKARYRKEKGMA